MAYDHKKIEKKWQRYWDEHKTFKTTEDPNKKKYYAMDMFPYPSGQGLHVGHPEGYTATDILYGNVTGMNIKRSRQRKIRIKRNITQWICSLIHQVKDCTLVTQKDTLQRIFFHG